MAGQLRPRRACLAMAHQHDVRLLRVVVPASRVGRAEYRRSLGAQGTEAASRGQACSRYPACPVRSASTSQRPPTLRSSSSAGGCGPS